MKDLERERLRERDLERKRLDLFSVWSIYQTGLSEWEIFCSSYSSQKGQN